VNQSSPPNEEEFLKQLLASANKPQDRFRKVRCGFCGTRFYPSEYLPKYCTHTCTLMAAEIRGGLISQDSYKAVKRFDEKAAEWQKTMAVLEEEYRKEQAEFEEKLKAKALEEAQKEVKVEPEIKSKPKFVFLDLNKRLK